MTTTPTTTSSLLITHLPEVALVTVLSHLTEGDRFSLSQTCRLFYELFSHPSLWQEANIHIMTTIPCITEEKKCTWNLIPVTDKQMLHLVNKWHSVVRRVSLEFSGTSSQLRDIFYEVLQVLSKACQIENLTIKTALSFDQVASSSLNYLNLLICLIHKSISLKHISVVTWPCELEAGDENSLLSALLNNSNIIHLKTLQLFYVDIKDGHWPKKISCLPSVKITLYVISHFKHLRCLSLRSTMLSNDLLTELAKPSRTPLQVLKILITYFNVPQINNLIDISSCSWAALKKASPDIRVEFMLTSRASSVLLEQIFQAHIPITSLTILKFGWCDSALLTLLPDAYSQSLQTFHSFCDSSNCDQALLSLVETCPKLQSLIYCGDITSQTIKSIAEVIHGQKRVFTTLKFKMTKVKVETSVDDDTVISKSSNNEYYLVALNQWHQDPSQLLQTLADLNQTVFCLTDHHCFITDV